MYSNQVNQSDQLLLFPIPSSAERYQMRAGIRLITENSFSIPSQLQRYFSTYKLFYWRGEFILSKIESGTITKDGIKYAVKFHRNLTRGQMLASKQNQFALSFRAPNEDWAILPVVIISKGI